MLRLLLRSRNSCNGSSSFDDLRSCKYCFNLLTTHGQLKFWCGEQVQSGLRLQLVMLTAEVKVDALCLPVNVRVVLLEPGHA